MVADFRDGMREYIKQATQEVENLKRSLARLPEGRLQLSNKPSGRYFVVVEPNGERRSVRDGDPHGIARVRKIQRRALEEHVLPRVENNLKIAKWALEHYQETDPIENIQELSPAYRTASEQWVEDIRHFEYRDDAAAWIERNNRQNLRHPESLIHLSSFGERFRSKGEMAIAELLHNEKIPFRYEPELPLDTEYGETVRYPDFEILLDNGETIYLEHMGLLSSEEYMQNVTEKLKLYYRNGICLGQNLLITTDAPDGSIDLSSIRKILNGFRTRRPTDHHARAV